MLRWKRGVQLIKNESNQPKLQVALIEVKKSGSLLRWPGYIKGRLAIYVAGIWT